MNRPRPVLTAAGIAGGVTSLAGVLTFLGYADAATSLSGQAQTIAAAAIGVIGLGSHLLAALHGQDRVTPLDDPVDRDGMPLVRLGTVHPSPAAELDGSPGVTYVADVDDDVSGEA